jgi:hypothetical protein
MTFPVRTRERNAGCSPARALSITWSLRSTSARVADAISWIPRALLWGCLLIAVLLLPTVASSQEKSETPPSKTDTILDNPGRFFSLKIPDGFKAESVDEPGIARWTKDSAEIYLAVGDIFQESTEALFEALRKAASEDKRIEDVRTLKLKKGRAVFYKEKPPAEPSRLQGWRLVVLTDKKVVNIDFTAPAKEFETFAPEFEKLVKSFKLRNGS